MMSSKFIAYFLEEVSMWQQTLANADQLINMWMEVQRTWLYLQSIFVSSDDICKQFPSDALRFQEIDHEFRVELCSSSYSAFSSPECLNLTRHLLPTTVLARKNLANTKYLASHENSEFVRMPGEVTIGAFEVRKSSVRILGNETSHLSSVLLHIAG